MKKSISAILLLIALLIPVSAQAASPRTSRVYPSLSFDSTTATCSVYISGNKTTDSIALTAKLWQGSKCITTWHASGTGYLNFSKTKTVSSGSSYKLTADVTINGKALDTVSKSGTCP